MNLIFLSLLVMFTAELPFMTNSAHDFHISRCEINYESNTGDLQVAAHIFLDDLETAISMTGRKDLFIATDKESKDCDKVIESYINKNLQLKINGKAHPAEMLGKELSKDKIAIWCYLEITGMRGLKNVELENKILTELFNDQKNIVDLTVNKKKKYFTVFDTKKVTEKYIL